MIYGFITFLRSLVSHDSRPTSIHSFAYLHGKHSYTASLFLISHSRLSLYYPPETSSVHSFPLSLLFHSLLFAFILSSHHPTCIISSFGVYGTIYIPMYLTRDQSQRLNGSQDTQCARYRIMSRFPFCRPTLNCNHSMRTTFPLCIYVLPFFFFLFSHILCM